MPEPGQSPRCGPAGRLFLSLSDADTLKTMKTEFVEVTETQKRLAVELPIDVVDAEIARITATLGRRAKIPGFRPGKVPTRVV
jgi:hypothetical protein